MSRHGTRVTAVVVTVGLLAACSGSSGGGHAAERSGAADSTGATQDVGHKSSAAAPLAPCDPLGGAQCLLPFPNDYFTVPEAGTATGRRVRIERSSTPANAEGTHVDPTEINRNDGFSPGSALTVQIPGLDLQASGAAPVTDIGASLNPNAPIVIVDTQTGERWPYWAELDAKAHSDDQRLLFVRPARNFLEGHRYAVGFRHLVGPKGAVDNPAFDVYRDKSASQDKAVQARRPAMERVFADLAHAGVARKQLALAWDFTVMSERSLSERILHMRDDAFAQLGDKAPKFTVTSVSENGGGSVLRTVKGTVQVPRYLTGDGATGTVLNNGTGPRDDPLPKANGTQDANFTCVIPRSAVGPDGKAVPTRMSLYGHGLLGSAAEVQAAGPVFASESNTTFCATDWIGMSVADIPTAVAILKDLSKFRTLADRLQQAMLDFLFLGRALKHPQGLSSDKSFQDAQGRSLLDTKDLVFVGNSQGGIIGGATTSVAQDWTRAVLGVPGMNYNTLLDRSVDFDTYAKILAPAYPSVIDQHVGLALVQQLWDRAENDGYAQHIAANPYPHTPNHTVLMVEAFGDHQVTNVTTEVMARTIKAKVRQPALAPGRSSAKQPFWGIDPIGSFPYRGSALLVWDFGTPTPPVENQPNRAGSDPHGKGAIVPEVRRAAATFLEPNGGLIDVCNGQPCRSS